MKFEHEPFGHLRADYYEPEPPAGPPHLRLTLAGAGMLFCAGFNLMNAIACLVVDRPLLALFMVFAAGGALFVAALDATREPARGWYVRPRGSLFYRRSGGRHHG